MATMTDAPLTLRDYFDGSLDLYCEIEKDGTFRYVNQAWTTVLGYEQSELIGRNFEEFLHPSDRASSREAFHNPDLSGNGIYQNRYRHKTGNYLTFFWSGHVDHRRSLVVTHARDVTDDVRKASLLSQVAAIQDVYMRLGTSHRGLFEQILIELLPALESTDGFIADVREDSHHGGKTLTVFARTPGYTVEEINRKSESVLRTGEPLILGTTERDSFCAIPLHELGELIGIIGVSHRHRGFNTEFLKHVKPVTEAIASILGLYHASIRETALRERFMVIVENLPMMLTEFGPSGRITWANRYYRDKIGFSEADLSSEDKLREVLGPDAERARTFMLSGRTDWEDFTLHHQNGQTFQSSWTNIRLKDGRAIGIGQDITERQIAESKMIQSSKMASLGEMSAGVSHEINNPLAIIQGSAFRAIQNLSDITPDTMLRLRDEVDNDLNRIIQNCDRIARIVRGLRAFSRSVEHEPFLPTSLSVVVEDVMNLAYERFINHKIRIHIDLGEPVTLDCRPVQLGQVLMNLLNNAYDAVSECDESDREIWIRARHDESTVEITVEDSGIGIPEAVHHRILEPFFTTKDVGKGTGLGLSISKGIVESHSGRIWLDTSSERTRFVIVLPLQQVD
jgi:PAS domain S-box-containing protein